MPRDSVGQTFTVAAVLCIACSVLVSAAAVGLRQKQEDNKDAFQKMNILLAAGQYDENVPIDDQFSNIETLVIDLATGEPVESSVMDPKSFDQRKAAKDPGQSVEIAADNDWAGIKRREKYAKVYLVRDDGKLTKVILPVYGKGLWSTLYGFVALEADLNTVAGLTFYEHKETPGLGGEVDNPTWKAKWPGKSLFDDNGELRIEVVKGEVPAGSKFAQHQVDGLSGATITSRGVSNLIRYWISEDAFGKYLSKLKTSAGGDNG